MRINVDEIAEVVEQLINLADEDDEEEVAEDRNAEMRWSRNSSNLAGASKMSATSYDDCEYLETTTGRWPRRRTATGGYAHLLYRAADTFEIDGAGAPGSEAARGMR